MAITKETPIDDMIEDVLVDSDLAKMLVPNKFKFTSQQGRVRRQQLLVACKHLLEEKNVADISLADICAKADIPRASAYHFFPNVQAVFLALRLLNAIQIIEALKTINPIQYTSWQGYIQALIDVGVKELNSDIATTKLIYGTNAPDYGSKSFGAQFDEQLAKVCYEALQANYDVPNLLEQQEVLAVGFTLVDAVLALSYRRHGDITAQLAEEAKLAVIAYLRTYLPEKLTRKMQ